jgi:hypothetical protein
MAAKETKKELRVEIAHGVGGILLGRAWVDGREVPFVQHESNGVYFIGTADLDASMTEPEPEIPADVAAANALSDAEKEKIHKAAEKAEADKAKATAKEEK